MGSINEAQKAGGSLFLPKAKTAFAFAILKSNIENAAKISFVEFTCDVARTAP
jgi:hypothetical protein